MKKKLNIVCLALIVWLGATQTFASGDLGQAEDKITQLSKDEVAKYFTESTIVGRDQEQGQCSQAVLDYRQKMAVRLLNQNVNFLWRFSCIWNFFSGQAILGGRAHRGPWVSFDHFCPCWCFCGRNCSSFSIGN